MTDDPPIPYLYVYTQSSEISTIEVSFLQRQSQEVHFSYTLAKSEPEKQQAVVSGWNKTETCILIPPLVTTLWQVVYSGSAFCMSSVILPCWVWLEKKCTHVVVVISKAPQLQQWSYITTSITRSIRVVCYRGPMIHTPWYYKKIFSSMNQEVLLCCGNVLISYIFYCKIFTSSLLWHQMKIFF